MNKLAVTTTVLGCWQCLVGQPAKSGGVHCIIAGLCWWQVQHCTLSVGVVHMIRVPCTLHTTIAASCSLLSPLSSVIVVLGTWQYQGLRRVGRRLLVVEDQCQRNLTVKFHKCRCRCVGSAPKRAFTLAGSMALVKMFVGKVEKKDSKL